MKSRSPFKAKIDIFQGSTSTYRHPSTVIQPIVGAQVGAQIAKTASEVTVKAIEAKSEKPKKQFDFKVGPKPEALTLPDYKGDLRSFGGKEYRSGEANRTFLSDLSPKKRQEAEEWIDKNPKKHKELLAKNKASNTNQYRTYSLDEEGKKTNFSDWRNSPNTMNGSPVKHDPGASSKGFFARTKESFAAAAGNTIKSQANPTRGFMSDIKARVNAIKSQGPARGGVSAEDFASGNYAKPADVIDATSADTFAPPPPNQVAETGSYSGGRDRILEMDSNPVINQSIGRDTNVASQLFGSGQRASMLAMKGPLYDKGHPDDYDGHTHRKKGASYKEGDYMDETDMETSYPKLHTQDVGVIKRDKKSQFMVSKNEDYNPTKIDTIRPLKGKEFKMGWGDAERNISTNPKYKKSK